MRYTEYVGKRGVVLNVYALVLFPILLAVGFGVEHSRMQNAQVRLQALADNAVLASTVDKGLTSQQRMTIATNYVNRETEYTITHMAAFPAGDNGVRLDLTGAVDRFMPSISSEAQLPVSVTATADVGRIYHEVYLAIDHSASMLLADGPGMAKRMMGLTEQLMLDDPFQKSHGLQGGCAFACHASGGWEDEPGRSALDMALDGGVTLRLGKAMDAARFAANTLLARGGDSMKVGIVKFADEVDYVLPPLSNQGSLSWFLRYDPYYLAGNDNGRTEFQKLFNWINGVIPISGSGSNASDPIRMVILITDGAFSGTYNGNYSERRAFDSALCDATKARGIKIAVLYTEYAPMPWSTNWITRAAEFANIEPNLRACASDIFEIVPVDGNIVSAMERLLEQLELETVRLTN